MHVRSVSIPVMWSGLCSFTAVYMCATERLLPTDSSRQGGMKVLMLPNGAHPEYLKPPVVLWRIASRLLVPVVVEAVHQHHVAMCKHAAYE